MKKDQTIYGIEILRFISAFAILIWHYQHFYSLDGIDFIKENQPFYEQFQFFYTYGFQGVNFFWCISGFIFYWKYLELIKKINYKNFFLLRFARLYPLHFLTLCLVALLQYIYLTNQEEFFLDHNNNLYHFFLQIFMASYWGFEDGHSFNSPIWSISLEILVYFLFYVLIRKFGPSKISNFLIILICLILKIIYEYNAHAFFDCALFFFIGGFVFLNIETVRFIKFHRFLSILLIILVLLISFEYELTKINNFTYVFQLFSYPLLLLIFIDLKFNNNFLKKISITIGNLTYSSYLIHLPIQMIIILFLPINLTIPFADDKLFFISYMLLVLIVSFFSYKYFESPMRKYIRNKANL